MGLVKPISPVVQRGHPLARGLVLACPVFEGSGAANDIANSGAATAFAAPPWVGSPYGSALSFNGSNQGIGLARNSGLTTSTPFMATVLFNAASLAPGFQSFAGTGQNGAAPFDGIYLSLRSSAVSFTMVDTSVNVLRVDTSSSISPNTWYLADFIYDGSKNASGVRIFLNGVEQATTTVSGGTSSNFSDRPWAIGADWGSYPSSLVDFFNGKVGLLEVRTGLGFANIVAQKAADPFAIYRKPSRWWEVVIAGGGTTVIRDSPLYLELLATQTRDGASALELLSTQQSNRPLNVELLGTQFVASGLPAELLSTQKSDAPIYLENLSGISTDRPAFAENLATQISAASLNLESLSTVISSSLAYLENLLTARADYTVQVESLGLISISIDGTISIELLSSQQTNNLVNSELLTTQVSNTPIDLEALSNVRTDNLAAAESLAGVRADNPIQAEILGLVSVSVDGTIVLEILTTVRRSDIVQLENISAVFALLTDGAIQLELLVGTAIPLDLTHSFTRLAPAEQFIRDLRKLLYTALVPYTEGRMPEVGALPNVQPNQKQTVGIDFGNFLPPGVALSGTPTVTLSTAFGTDPAAASRIVSGPFVGTANKNIGGTGLAGTAIIFQVGGCLPGVTYVVDAYCTRTDGDIAEASTRFSCNAPN